MYESFLGKNNYKTEADVIKHIDEMNKEDIIELLKVQKFSYGFFLMDACFWGYHDIAIKLIEKGANIDKKDRRGWTSLMHAIKGSNSKTAKYLIDLGAKLNSESNKEGPLIMACDNEMESTALELIEYGADINERNFDNGFTPLFYACMNNMKKIVTELIKRKVNLDAKNRKGYTALKIACENGNDNIAIQLIDAGADIYVKDRKGKMFTDYEPFPKVLKHLQFIHRNQILESVIQPTIIGNCFNNNSADLNLIDLIVDYLWSVRDENDSDSNYESNTDSLDDLDDDGSNGELN